MVEVLVAGGFVGAAVAALSRRSAPALPATADDIVHSDVPDLPCPWCEAPTREEDSRCPSCGQRFG